jgi:two-component system cell cycle response regulator
MRTMQGAERRDDHGHKGMTARLLWPVAAAVLFMMVYGGWQVFRWGGLAHKQLIGDLFFVPVNAVAVIGAVRAGLRCRVDRKLLAGWLLIALALLSYLFGDVAQTVYEVVLHQKPYPSLADPLYLAFYPLMMAGVLQFRSWQGVRSERLKLGLDAATVGLGGAALVWYLVLGPSALAPGQSVTQTFFSVAYPTGDLVLIVALAAVLLRGVIRASAVALGLLVASLSFFVLADMIYGYVSLHSGYSGGDPVDSLWMAAISLVGLAAAAQRSPAVERARGRRMVGGRASWLPYGAVLLAFGTLGYASRGERFFPTGGLVLAAILITVVVAARQLVAQRELIEAHREVHAAHDELAALATKDPLTGLPNHRALVAVIEGELERSARYARSCAVLFLDVDHFKALNDSYGHAAGDAVLRELGGVVSRCLRTIDTIGRWGGEEFVVVLPESGGDGAWDAAERLRATIAAHHFAAADGPHLTCSVGVAVYPEDGQDRATLVESADRAMYAAKRLGRNQAITASDPAVTALHRGSGDASREQQALLGAVDALAMLVDVRDHYTGMHGTEVGVLAREAAVVLGCDEKQVELVHLAARLHDVGKVAVPDAILQKPGRLTDEEWQIIKTHPVVGAEIVSRVPGLRAVAPIIGGHHERWDGTGYPEGIAGEAIPLGARIVAAADSYAAMTSERPYSEPRDAAAALAELQRCSGSQFDPRVIQALERVVTQTSARQQAA